MKDNIDNNIKYEVNLLTYLSFSIPRLSYKSCNSKKSVK